MKTPRVDTFIPKKQSVPELKSSLENMPPIEKPKPQPAIPAIPTPVPPVRGVPPVASRRKIKSRHPFDIYQDQLEELRKLALEERMQGGVGSMSAMVREAIDALINKKRGRV